MEADRIDVLHALIHYSSDEYADSQEIYGNRYAALRGCNGNAGDPPQTFDKDISKIENFVKTFPTSTQIPREMWLILRTLGLSILDFAHVSYNRADLRRFIGVAAKVARLPISGLYESESQSRRQEEIKALYLKGVEIDVLWEKTERHCENTRSEIS